MERRNVARNRPARTMGGAILTAARAVTARAHLMTPRAAPAGAFGWPEVPFFEQ